MFKEESHKKLPEHQDWDHEIPIEEREKPTYRSIYALSETKLKALREYLDKNLKKRIHITIYVTCRIPNTVCSKERWKTTTVCRLQTAERNNG